MTTGPVPRLPSLVRRVLVVGVFLLTVGCGISGEARTEFKAGQRAIEQQNFREALEHFRRTTERAPSYGPAHEARGDAAEILGEFREALDEYQAAARASASPAIRMRLGAAADRMGQFDLALQSLDGADRPKREHAWEGIKLGLALFGDCAWANVANVSMLWRFCVPMSIDRGQEAFRASRDNVTSYELRILVEAGRRDRAIQLARSRGWVHDGTDYCNANELEIPTESTALLAMLVHPQQADCVLAAGAEAVDDGFVRLGRIMLQDRVEKSASPDVRERAAWTLRYRAPDHDVSKLSESLNLAGGRLHLRLHKPDDAREVYEKAIAADPTFSWPYNNIGWLYADKKDYEQAATWFAKALEVNPNHWRAQFSLGYAVHQMKRYDDALAAYAKAMAMNPGDAQTIANMGWAWIAVGRDTEGLDALQAALKIDPRLAREREYLNSRFGRDARRGPTPFGVR